MQIELLTVKTLCDRYDVQPITIRRWIARGLFPAPLRVGRRKIFWPADVVAEFETRNRSTEDTTAAVDA